MTTAHLSHVEIGIYRRLLDHYWSSDNKLPRDAVEIAERIGEKVFNWRRYGITSPAGFDNEEVTVKVVGHLLNEFFEQDEDGNWRHLWLDEYRKATDTQFRERSKASKERVARQSRGAKGKFGKTITVTDGDSPCPTVENILPNGEVTVEQSKDKADQTKEEQTKGEQTKALEVEVALPQEERSSGVLVEEFPQVASVKNVQPTEKVQGRPGTDRTHEEPQTQRLRIQAEQDRLRREREERFKVQREEASNRLEEYHRKHQAA